MLNRWSVLVLLAGVIVGHSIAGPSLTAQDDPIPVEIGDRVTFVYDREDHQSCTVAEIRGGWVRCGPPAGATRIGRQPVESWQNTRFVLRLSRNEN